MKAVIVFCIGVLTGVLIAWMISKVIKDEPIGNLREDRSDPDSPYYFLEIDKGFFNELNTRETITLRVLRENYLKE